MTTHPLPTAPSTAFKNQRCVLDGLPSDTLGHILHTVLVTQGPLLFQRLTKSYPSLDQIARTDPLVYRRTLYLDIPRTVVDANADGFSSAWSQLAENLSVVFPRPQETNSVSTVTAHLTPQPRISSSSMLEAVKPLLTVAHCKVSLDFTLWVDDIGLLGRFLYDLDSVLSSFCLPSNVLKLVHRGAQSPKLTFPWRPPGTWTSVGRSTWPISYVLAPLVRPCAGCGEHRLLFSHPRQTRLACSQVNCRSDDNESDLCNRCRPRTQCWECGQAVQCDKCWLNVGWTKYSPLRSVCTSLTHRTGTISVPWVCQPCTAAAREKKRITGRGWVCMLCVRQEGGLGTSVQ